jgi:hypothetical protein
MISSVDLNLTKYALEFLERQNKSGNVDDENTGAKTMSTLVPTVIFCHSFTNGFRSYLLNQEWHQSYCLLCAVLFLSQRDIGRTGFRTFRLVTLASRGSSLTRRPRLLVGSPLG